MSSFVDKIRHRLLALRLEPIRVFCFHQTSETFDAAGMWECDWTQIDLFKQNLLLLKEQYTFITLPEAYEKLQHDTIRCKKFAVLTADDGWASLKNIIPWLAEHQIPITLFVNPAYLDSHHYQNRPTERLLSRDEIIDYVTRYSPCITIASHGFNHVDACKLSSSEFENNVVDAENALAKMPNKIPYYAFAYGHYLAGHLDILRKCQIVPVLVDRKRNYTYDGVIHRESIDGKIGELC